MRRDILADMLAFLAVARERSFTRAAARLGVSPSALSHTIRKLEAQLGIRLLTRTSRSVSPTEAGERLLGSVGPHLDAVQAELEGLNELRDKPAGTIRITATDDSAESIILPAVAPLLANYPDLNVEIDVDGRLVDIAAERFDAGVRLGETVDQDMVALRIGPDLRMATVASPAYLAGREPPRTPHDLAGHDCINLRLPTRGALYVWEYEKAGRPLNVRVTGQLTVNTASLVRRAALGGLGVAHLPEQYFQPDLATGALIRLLDDWCPPFPGYHLYYPSRRHHSPAFALLVEALRFRG